MDQLASPRRARRNTFAVAVLLALAVAACSTSATSAPTAADTVAAATASPTATATPTATPTPAPTDTPSPSITPTPSATAKPTPKVTPLPPLAIGLCTGAQLKLTITSWNFDGTWAYAHLTAQNVSSAACNMRGTGRARILNRYGSVLADAGTSAAKVAVSDPTYPLNPGDSINTITTWGNWCKSAPAQKVTVQMIQPFGLGSYTAAANGNAPIPTCYMSGSKSTVSSEKWLP